MCIWYWCNSRHVELCSAYSVWSMYFRNNDGRMVWIINISDMPERKPNSMWNISSGNSVQCTRNNSQQKVRLRALGRTAVISIVVIVQLDTYYSLSRIYSIETPIIKVFIRIVWFFYVPACVNNFKKSSAWSEWSKDHFQ